VDRREQARVCARKDRHPTEARAQGMIKDARRRGYTGSDTLRCYECPVCGFWHLTSAPPLARTGWRPSPALVAAQGGRS
jgi:rubrerythrin